MPLPDPRRVDELEQRIYREFVVTPPPSGRTNVLTIRRRRRQVLVAGLGLAAAASAAAMIMNRDVSHGFELQAATGAVALFPDGESRAVHSGDEIPAGGLIQTGPAGAVTIEGTTIGSDQVVLVSEAGLTLLPAPTTPPEAQVEPPATPAPSSAPATAPPPASPPPAETPIAAPAGDQPVAPVPYSAPLGALALTVGEDTGGVNLAWTPSDAEAFDRYVVVRGTTTTRQLEEIAAAGRPSDHLVHRPGGTARRRPAVPGRGAGYRRPAAQLQRGGRADPAGRRLGRQRSGLGRPPDERSLGRRRHHPLHQ